jgi:hypothetical protein
MTFLEWLLEHNGISSMLTFGAIVVALLPVFREMRHKLKYRRILREQLYNEIKDFQSFLILKIVTETDGKSGQNVNIDRIDEERLNKIQQSFEKSTYLGNFERKELANMIQTFRAGWYRQDSPPCSCTSVEIIDNINSYTEKLLKYLEKKLK